MTAPGWVMLRRWSRHASSMSRKRASKASSIVGTAPPGLSSWTRRWQASGPRSFSSRSKIVPPRITASRREGGKEGRALSRRRRITAARERPTWRGEEARRPGGGEGGVVGGDHQLRVEPLGGAAQRLFGVVAGGAPFHVRVVE